MIASHDQLIEQIAQSIFATMFELELFRTDDDSPGDEESLIATVHIAGAWTGCVLIALSPGIARITAAHMLSLAADAVTTEDEREVASEIVNMVGGNLKSLLPAPSFLSLPTIISGADFGLLMHEAELVDSLTLDSETGRVQIRLYEKKNS
jgi:chemotaxis protein CheX